MPIYEYRCQGCDHRFESLTFGNRTATCPECQSADVQKLLSAFAVGGGGGSASRSYDRRTRGRALWLVR